MLQLSVMKKGTSKFSKIFFSRKLFVVYIFLVILFLGTFFLCLPWSSKERVWTSFLDALFVSSSAMSGTGLTTLNIGSYFSVFGKCVILMLLQLGSLGFITIIFLVFYLSKKKIGYQERITVQVISNKEDTRNIVKYLLKIVLVTLLIELIGVILLAPYLIKKYSFWAGLGHSIFLSVSSFCNAGMDSFNNGKVLGSLTLFQKNVLIILPVAFLIIIGGIGFGVIFDIFQKKENKKRRLSLSSLIIIIVTSILFVGGTIFFLICEWNNPNTIGNMNFGEKLLNSFFLSVSSRTAGFYSFDITNLTQASIVMIDILMFIGGSPVSSAGGIKVTTFFILLLLIFKNCNSNNNIVIFKKQICGRTIIKTIRVFMTFLCIILLSSFIILLSQNGVGTFNQVIFEVISAITTTGFTLNFTTYLTTFSQIIIILLMLIGRIGIIIISLMYTTKEQDVAIDYQDVNITIG